MIKPSICFEMLYGDSEPAEKIRKIADAGFQYVEFWSWRDKDINAMKAACEEYEVRVSNFSGQRAGDLVNTSTHKVLLDDYRDALKTAEKLGNSTLMVLTNELGDEGVVMNSYPDKSVEEKNSAAIEGLKKLSLLIPAGGKVVLEPLNTVRDHAGYHLYDLGAAVSLLGAVGDKRIKILCDLYHQGMMGDDLVQLVRRHIDNIGYFHAADFPGRHEPGTGSADWRSVLSEIRDSGYEGFVGFEYSPAGDSDKSLAAIKDLWDSVF